ncbi:MAG: ABC transporter ATP-binding protein [Xanthomonadales bacterium]|nr:ABC transporter ATP-binding protein [Xanthomonadales bacterium]MDH4021215.1 ABC transporter ATP-binding protein [Xanthomonadales bacterium]
MTELAIQAHGLCKDFGKVKAVNGLNLEVPRSRIYGFLGPNGSGKTTAIRMLCGLLTPTAGDISVLGYSIPDEAEALRLKVGYMTQKFSLFEDLTVSENLQFMADIYTLDRTLKGQRIGLAVERYELERLVKQRAGTLSGGQKQRLALAASTLHGPDLLFLDEPTSAVDPENRRAFWEALFDLVGEGTTILVSTHYMDEAERCHALAILDKGKLVAEGSPEALQQGIDASIVLVESDQPRKVGKLLEQQAFVHSSAQVGNVLRVMVSIDQASPASAVSDAIRQQGLHVDQCAVARPALEDVFVAATRKKKGTT